MWECNQCETKNEDNEYVCSACGSNKVEELSEIQTNTTRSIRIKKQGVCIVSKGYYMGSIIGSWVTLFIFSFLTGISASNGSQAMILFIILAFGAFVFMIVLFAKLWYIAWESVQDEYARTTPGKAVGFSFIPIFNLYWVFQLSLGFAKDFNSYINRYNITSSRVPEGLFLTFAILTVVNIFLSRIPGVGIVFPFIELIIALFVVSNLCDAINSIPATSKQTVDNYEI